MIIKQLINKVNIIMCILCIHLCVDKNKNCSSNNQKWKLYTSSSKISFFFESILGMLLYCNISLLHKGVIKIYLCPKLCDEFCVHHDQFVYEKRVYCTLIISNSIILYYYTYLNHRILLLFYSIYRFPCCYTYTLQGYCGEHHDCWFH